MDCDLFYGSGNYYKSRTDTSLSSRLVLVIDLR